MTNLSKHLQTYFFAPAIWVWQCIWSLIAWVLALCLIGVVFCGFGRSGARDLWERI